jgi:hypothetical protein
MGSAVDPSGGGGGTSCLYVGHLFLTKCGRR